jgi:3-oxoacyl-[acyl-carrier protein] reductase
LSRPAAATLTFAEIRPGDAFSVEHVFGAAEVERFAELSGDFSPLHVDPSYAAGTEFGGCVVHGMLLAALFSRLVGMHLPGRHALYLGQDLAFRRPVLVGERVVATARVSACSEATQTIVLATEIRGADGRTAVSGTAKVKVRERGVAAPAAGAPAPAVARGTRRVVLVTGASRGIGAGIARVLGERGWDVAVNYHRSADAAASVVADIERAGARALAVPGDVRDPEAVARMVGGVVAGLGGLDAVVNNAVGDFTQTPFGDLGWEQVLGQLEYQVKAVMQVCQAAHPHLRASGRGAVVNLLSQVCSGAPPPQVADYVTGKHALEGLSRAMAVEWAADGIRVNMVSPGLVQTELTQHYPERVFRAEAARTPLRRLATPLDVARAVACLLGEDGEFITGFNLYVTGGQVMS